MVTQTAILKFVIDKSFTIIYKIIILSLAKRQFFCYNDKCINMVIKFPEFSNQLNQNKINSIYLFEGEDAYFRIKGVENLKAKVVSEIDLNFASFNGDVTENELLSSLQSYSFFGDTRLTVIKEFYPDKKVTEGYLKPFLNSPYENSILAIVNEKPCETLKKYPSVCVVDCSKLDVGNLTRMVKGECEKHGVEIQLETAKLLVDDCLANMSKISNELEKLIAYAYETKRIEKQDVELLVSKDTDFKVYKMTECIANRQVNDALTIINDMLAKGDPPQRIISSVYNYFRKLLHVSISSKSLLDLAKVFGVTGSYAEFIMKKTKEQAQKFTPKALKKAVDTLTDFDYKSKSGLIDMSEGMWLSLFKIMLEK